MTCAPSRALRRTHPFTSGPHGLRPGELMPSHSRQGPRGHLQRLLCMLAALSVLASSIYIDGTVQAAGGPGGGGGGGGGGGSAPAVTGVTPNVGPAAGGTLVTLTGNFSAAVGATVIKFGDNTA